MKAETSKKLMSVRNWERAVANLISLDGNRKKVAKSLRKFPANCWPELLFQMPHQMIIQIVEL